MVLFHPFPTFSLPCEMAGHQLYDMMHSLLHNIATGTASGSPGNCGPNLQLSSQMTQPMNLVPSPNSQTASFTPFPMMPYGGLSNFGNPMAMMPYGGPPNYGNLAPGTIMPFMTQSSMPSSLPEPQPARAPEAAAAAPAATSSTNHPPPDTRHHPHSRRSRSRHRQHRHSHSHTSHHRRHNKSHRRHDTRRSRSYSRSRSPSRHLHHSRRAHHSTVSLRSRSPRHRSHHRHSPAPRATTSHRPTHTTHDSTSWRTSGKDSNKSQWSSSHWRNQSWGHPPQNKNRWDMHHHGASHTAHRNNQDKRSSWSLQHHGQQPHPTSRTGHHNTSLPPHPAPAAAFTSTPPPPPRPTLATPHPPQPPFDDTDDLDPPPSEADINATTTSDNRWLDLWRNVMDTAKTDPLRVPTPRELGELDPLPALDISRMEQTKAILMNLDPALPPSHADLLAECWELRTMNTDDPIPFDPSFYHLLGRESHGMVFATTWFPRPHPWPVAGGDPEAGSGTASHHAVMYVHGTTPDRVRRMCHENMIRPAAWRPENHDYPSFGCYAQATPTACTPDTLGQLLQNFTIGKSQLGAIAFGELRSINQHKILESGGSHEDQHNVRRHFACRRGKKWCLHSKFAKLRGIALQRPA